GIRYDVTSCARLPLTVIGPTDIFLSDVPLVKALQLHLLHLCSPPAADTLPAAATPLLPSPRASCALLCSPPAADTLPAAATPLLPSPHSSCALLCSPTAADNPSSSSNPASPISLLCSHFSFSPLLASCEGPAPAPVAPLLPTSQLSLPFPLLSPILSHFPPLPPPFPYQPLHRGVAGIDANAPLPLRPHRLLRLSIVGVVVSLRELLRLL
ncbi:unnamed protein product, partial [Closterium sp. NIES-64]